MRPFFVILFLFILVTPQARALSRVYKLKFGDEDYYALTIQPKFERPYIENFAEVMDEHDRNDMNLHYYLARALKRPEGQRGDATLEAIKFFVFDGDVEFFSKPGHDLLYSEYWAMKEVIGNPYLLAHEVEKALVRMGSEWYIAQVEKRLRKEGRRRKDPEFTASLRLETEACKNAIGYVMLFDGKKNFMGMLAVAARTSKSPRLPVEVRHKIWLGDYQPGILIFGNPYIDRNGKIALAETGMSPSITVELKKYIVDRKSKIDLFPVLLFFAEQSGMTFRGPQVDDFLVSFGQDTSHSIWPAVSRYILATDEARAQVYTTKPYTFTRDRVMEEDHILQATRDQFIDMWRNPRSVSTNRVDGKLFLSSAEIVGGIVPPDLIRCADMMEGYFTPIRQPPGEKR